MILGPRDPFLNTEAAAMVPAIIGIAATAFAILTSERPGPVFFGKMGDRQPNDGDEVRKESEARNQLAGEKAPEPFPSKPAHEELDFLDTMNVPVL